jgi:hypothetical protein
MERQEAEFWTWVLTACIAGALPIERVIESHAEGGLYDSVDLMFSASYLNGIEVSPRISINREGQVHTLRGSEVTARRDLLSDLGHGLPLDDATAWLRTQVHATGHSDPVLTNSLESMSQLLRHCIGKHDESIWEWRNGYLDSLQSSVRREKLFDTVHGASAACVAQPDDLFNVPEYRFWFLVHGGTPLLAVEPARGLCFAGDVSFSLMDSGGTDRMMEFVLGPAHPATEADSSESRLASLREKFREIAASLARTLAGESVKPFEPTPKASTRAAWFTARADSVLLVVVGDHEQPRVMDKVLAYALAWQGDRDLVLVLPEGYERSTLMRLAWIDSCVRVFVYGPEHLPRPAIIWSQEQTMIAAKSLRREPHRDHDLEPVAALVAPIISWAESERWLSLDQRSDYVAWKCCGLQMLKAARTGESIELIVGVNYTGRMPVGGRRPIKRRVTAENPLSPGEITVLQDRILAAIAVRRESDATYVEHRLQAALEMGPLHEGLGLTEVVPEYPVWRSDNHSGLIDFLGVDGRGRIHLVETKVNPDDVSTVLQALDYAVWLKANEAAIRQLRGWKSPRGDKRIVLDLVFAPKLKATASGTTPDGGAIGGYLANQLEVLSREFRTQVWIVRDPGADAPIIDGPWNSPPTGEEWKELVRPAVGTRRWLERADAVVRHGARPNNRSIEESALPMALSAFIDIKRRGLDHPWIGSVRSSQALALNLFAPIGSRGIASIFEQMGSSVREPGPIEFEYTDPKDRLEEVRPTSDHQTQIDVVLRGMSLAGERLAALVEVKFTEEFGSCSAYENPHNDNLAACRSAGLFGGPQSGCFQLRNHGEGRRLYDTFLAGTPVILPNDLTDEGGCLVRRQLSQPTRSLALGHLLVAAGEIDRFIYAVCAPSGFASAWLRVRELQSAFPDTAVRQIYPLTVESVASLHDDGGAAFRSHYRGLFDDLVER